MNSAKPLTVVLIDDSQSMRALLRTILTTAGFSVIGEAASAEAALTLIDRLKPAVVTLDLLMPGKSGIEILPEIRTRHPDLYVIVVSASDDQPTLRQALDLGAIAFITKPFTSGNILRVFEQIAAVSRKRTSGHAADTAEKKPGKRCVLVDDNRSIRALLRAILEDAGLKVVGEAGDGMEGLLMIEREHPHYVFLDIDMPQLDGVNTLICLRAIHPTLRVIMITSHADRETIAATMDQKVSGYILKPFTTEKVVEVLRKLGALAV